MFTGIVEAIGTVREPSDEATTRHFRVEAPSLARDLELGDSVCVDGACLTVSGLVDGGFTVDVIGSTLARTIARSYRDGSRVNLERAVQMGTRLDGHLVQGHVDGLGHLMQSEKSGESWLMDFALPSDVFSQTIEHGSVTVNGVSLTVSELLVETGVRIGIIPFTHEHTNLGDLRPGDPVNVEGDVIGKYIGRLLAQRGDAP